MGGSDGGALVLNAKGDLLQGGRGSWKPEHQELPQTVLESEEEESRKSGRGQEPAGQDAMRENVLRVRMNTHHA